MVAATLSKPLSRECLFNPLSERLSTLPGSGVYVAREPHLPRNESFVSLHHRVVEHDGQCSRQKYTLLLLLCNPKCGKKIPRSLIASHLDMVLLCAECPSAPGLLSPRWQVR
jgi:hypothetical protein